MNRLAPVAVSLSIVLVAVACETPATFPTFSASDDEPITRETFDEFVECDEGYEERCQCVKDTAFELVPSIEGINLLVEQGSGGARPVPGARRDSRLTLAVMQATDICASDEPGSANAKP
ncbi:MAG: hypothetical protein PVI23_12965 [Maricaulaceae bacterium]|jgi:hypothetical protein